MKRAIVTVGLGFGDEGKGAWVDHLVRKFNAELVIRYSGGSQCGHNVQLANGHRHTFSQLGAGTFAGAKTYLGPQVIINPNALQNEMAALQKVGLSPARTLVIHPKCLVSTVFHQYLNMFKELARGNKNHGSCGHGIGETRSYWLKYGNDAIYAGDLKLAVVLREKLELLRQRCLIEIDELASDQSSKFTINPYKVSVTDLVSDMVRFANSNISTSPFAPDFETAIFEGAQGVLLDEWYGFHPHTTWSTVTPHHALEMFGELGVEEYTVLGLTRSYTTRHGNGPLPTADAELTAKLEDPGNPPNEWQGKLRAGWLDLVLLNYGVQACREVNHILISHLDQLDANKINLGYDEYDLNLDDHPRLSEQKLKGERIKTSKCVLRNVNTDELINLVNDVRPVAGLAYGPTSGDRKLSELNFMKVNR